MAFVYVYVYMKFLKAGEDSLFACEPSCPLLICRLLWLQCRGFIENGHNNVLFHLTNKYKMELEEVMRYFFNVIYAYIG